ncbi:MAG: ATP-binding cassette domain-containing protein [Chitinophagaceae bacterium]|nr:MAG: ATP-binding cassette domain-containing protein [Chitinophagaceae bacterium]
MAKAIRVENVSKQYRLGQIGTGSLSHDINRWWHTVRGKEDPYLKIGETNDRTKKGDSQYVWSLRDITFDIEQGDSVGIIGRNGAGKSTLLKILSRVTAPTTGSLKIKGRIASLLEVGTGFHPELSGRDNIFLNGAILGMRKHEIKKKFDEIVDFAGVERYIDTPVKRYSSGMYVRLAFAVAAHLDSEILIVDEVLAVGDAEFQKKCLGKLGDVSRGEGRTVLFVSHSMTSIQTLCKSSIYLTKGVASGILPVNVAVSNYLYGSEQAESNGIYHGDNKTTFGEYKNLVNILEVAFRNTENVISGNFKTTEPIIINIIWENISGVSCSPNIQLKTAIGNVVALIASDSKADWTGEKKKAQGKYISKFTIPGNWLNANDYFLSVALDSHSPRVCYEAHNDILKLTLTDPMDETSIARGMFTSVREDAVLWPALDCSFEKID